MKVPAAAVLSLSLTAMAAAWWHAAAPVAVEVPGALRPLPLAAPFPEAAAAVCRPLRCEWSAPGFSPASQQNEVFVLPCPPFAASAPAATGSYPVTLTVRCVLAPQRFTVATHVVEVEPRGFRDGFETGDLSRWTWRIPT